MTYAPESRKINLYPTQKSQAISEIELDPHKEALDAIHEQLIRMEMYINKGTEPYDPFTFLDLYDTVSNQSTLTLTNKIDRPIVALSILTSTPAASTSTLQIGTRIFNIVPGTSVITSVQMIITPNSVIILSSSSSTGTLTLEIMGRCLRGSEYRVIP